MAEKLSSKIVDSLPWLDGLADTVGSALDPVLGSKGPKSLQDALNGVWFGHPLHPAVVVLPLGAWTSMALLDLAGLEEAADLNLKVGLLGAVGAAATGAAQWQDARQADKPRRVGILHATLNIIATVLVALSWLLRARGARRPGVALSTIGVSISAFSAWLGGDLAYDLGIGVNHTAFEQPPTEWTEALDAADLVEDKPMRVIVAGAPVMVLRQGSQIYAISATCSHLGGPLEEGQITADTVTCPWHGSIFCVRDGALLHGPATVAQPAYDVRESDGKISIKAQSA